MENSKEIHSKIKVLYIAGFERSGSTIVNRVLGQIEGFVAWGELRDIWEHGKIENRACTCGQSFHECSAWNEILDHQFDQTLGLTAEDMLRLKKQTRAAVLLKSLGSIGETALKHFSKEYSIGLSQLYSAIETKTNSRVIVDSTKASWYGYVLSQLPSIDLYTIHIVRDPRGVCYSLQRRKEQGDVACQWYRPWHAAIAWRLKNFGVERLLNTSPERYLRMQYEDFMRDPEASVKSILTLIGESQSQLPFVRKSTVKMGLDHIVTGSPSSRSDMGEVELRTDNRWKQKISQRDKSLITRVTRPLLQKYGYAYKV